MENGWRWEKSSNCESLVQELGISFSIGGSFVRPIKWKHGWKMEESSNCKLLSQEFGSFFQHWRIVGGIDQAEAWHGILSGVTLGWRYGRALWCLDTRSIFEGIWNSLLWLNTPFSTLPMTHLMLDEELQVVGWYFGSRHIQPQACIITHTHTQSSTP
jgi:hypothetical protein